MPAVPSKPSRTHMRMHWPYGSGLLRSMLPAWCGSTRSIVFGDNVRHARRPCSASVSWMHNGTPLDALTNKCATGLVHPKAGEATESRADATRATPMTARCLAALEGRHPPGRSLLLVDIGRSDG
eukprot:CAMPEP_0182920126 /NCGR_PEP_ID=MMETSP0105_2-20130417/3238_1 /TAXON_ID=81532 ORGANISM="Acanthoeca-like sp., Strain 10tr" /NCGR_SAMPLE_ID=MMETSP0105_2 /ASSEMBLY_ACC=CAM_ASM_000205 /LENGTH=124 /DNA_ID=CAMNT_0025057465 /DNA_START=491 /DNA_END=865 /DNA_ORIENTATION=+